MGLFSQPGNFCYCEISGPFGKQRHAAIPGKNKGKAERLLPCLAWKLLCSKGWQQEVNKRIVDQDARRRRVEGALKAQRRLAVLIVAGAEPDSDRDADGGDEHEGQHEEQVLDLVVLRSHEGHSDGEALETLMEAEGNEQGAGHIGVVRDAQGNADEDGVENDAGFQDICDYCGLPSPGFPLLEIA